MIGIILWTKDSSLCSAEDMLDNDWYTITMMDIAGQWSGLCDNSTEDRIDNGRAGAVFSSKCCVSLLTTHQVETKRSREKTLSTIRTFLKNIFIFM